MRILNPNRTKYKKTFRDKSQCVFCQKNDPLECVVLAGEFWRVIANRYPYMDGNLMLVPKRHVERVGDLSADEWHDFGVVLTNTQDVLGAVFDTQSFNVGLNLGPESGASIAHLHWQVVPRKFKNITVVNTFADLYSVEVTSEETIRRIKAFFAKQKPKGKRT